MNKIIIAAVFIILALLLAQLIIGDDNSILSEGSRILNETRTEMQTIQP